MDGISGKIRDIRNGEGGPDGAALLPPDAWHQLQTALRLSPRELQIMRCIFGDEKRTAIAHRLGISPGTVNTYFQRLYSKLQVASRPQLIVRVVGTYLSLPHTEKSPHEGTSCAVDSSLANTRAPLSK